MSDDPQIMRADAIILAATVPHDYRRYVSAMVRNRLQTISGRLEITMDMTGIEEDAIHHLHAAQTAVRDMLKDMQEVLL